LRRVDPREVVTGEANARWVRRKLQTATIAPEEHWSELAGGNVEVRLVRADHRHRPMPHRPNDAHGMLVRAEGVTIWFAGDTSLYDEMADLPDLAGSDIDLALLPIGGWGPRLSPGHMDGWQAAQAAGKVGARLVVPIHWGTFAPVRMAGPWMDRPAVHLEEELGELADGPRLVRPAPGEVLELGDD
jgi:L-ascorbate metabolism protein UlaG (beta-lactamase superfamily)